MIGATIPGSASLASRLVASIRSLAAAHAEELARARQGDAGRWRRASLLWPLFTKD